MEAKPFVGRRDELKLLFDSLQRAGPELIIVYGRRRVGKSRLLEELSRKRVIDISVMLEEADYNTNLLKFSRILSQKYNYPSFSPVSFRDAFSNIPEGASIIIDEFSYISATSEFQAIWEEVCRKKNHKLILCGSMIRTMEDIAYSIKSPLYGRATTILKLLPLRFSEVLEWYPKSDIRDVIETYFCVGGIPRYLELLPVPGQKEVIDSFISKNSILLREGKLLLKESFPSSEIYPKIMFALARGYTAPVKIANEIKIPAQQISKYLQILSDYGFAERRMPFLGGGKKDVRYYMADVFFDFWIRFVWPAYNEIESGNMILPSKENLNTYFGRRYEQVIKELYHGSGMQWGKNYEIDILLKDGNDFLVIECKWQDDVDAVLVLENMKESSKNLPAGNKKYIIYSRSFKRTTKEANCYSLHDLKHLFLH